ncbi:ligase;5-formyltetrahydrofolate cycloligase family [Candidatus Blochmanniella floridana]|uniref:5-formyltetrahydrofolate cyclo-ligase n=1 Tax=Blochmanniella floridana TaxID=203907 RepID=Q7VRG0_BLOFL|nr:ligase;5-formyltetrahydrofolate cycloligase family [Candidatus Blochmannia floridanus]
MNLNKKAIRSYIRSLRQSLNYSEQYKSAQLITNKIINLDCIHKATHIGIYISFDGEIYTDLLIKFLLSMKKKIYIPVLLHKQQHLLFAPYTLSTPTIQNYLNVYEPKYNIIDLISLDKLDIIFIPLVAFDDHGNRLGMGGGFYDKTLQYQKHKSHCIYIGLGHDFQKIPTSILTQEKWDVKLPKIITPSYLHWHT